MRDEATEIISKNKIDELPKKLWEKNRHVLLKSMQKRTKLSKHVTE